MTSSLTGLKDDVVSKPFRMPELIPKIEELVLKSAAVSTTTTEKIEPSSSKTS